MSEFKRMLVGWKDERIGTDEIEVVVLGTYTDKFGTDITLAYVWGKVHPFTTEDRTWRDAE